MASYTIYVRTLTGRSFPLVVCENDTVLDIKTKICDRENVPTSAQELIFRGKKLVDKQIAREISLEQESQLARAPEPQVEIFIKSQIGQHFGVSVRLSDTVLVLKTQLAALVRRPVETIALSHNAKPMPDQASLAECGIVRESIVKMELLADLLSAGAHTAVPSTAQRIVQFVLLFVLRLFRILTSAVRGRWAAVRNRIEPPLRHIAALLNLAQSELVELLSKLTRPIKSLFDRLQLRGRVQRLSSILKAGFRVLWQRIHSLASSIDRRIRWTCTKLGASYYRAVVRPVQAIRLRVGTSARWLNSKLRLQTNKVLDYVIARPARALFNALKTSARLASTPPAFKLLATSIQTQLKRLWSLLRRSASWLRRQYWALVDRCRPAVQSLGSFAVRFFSAEGRKIVAVLTQLRVWWLSKVVAPLRSLGRFLGRVRKAAKQTIDLRSAKLRVLLTRLANATRLSVELTEAQVRAALAVGKTAVRGSFEFTKAKARTTGTFIDSHIWKPTICALCNSTEFTKTKLRASVTYVNMKAVQPTMAALRRLDARLRLRAKQLDTFLCRLVDPVIAASKRLATALRTAFRNGVVHTKSAIVRFNVKVAETVRWLINQRLREALLAVSARFHHVMTWLGVRRKAAWARARASLLQPLADRLLALYRTQQLLWLDFSTRAAAALRRTATEGGRRANELVVQPSVRFFKRTHSHLSTALAQINTWQQLYLREPFQRHLLALYNASLRPLVDYLNLWLAYGRNFVAEMRRGPGLHLDDPHLGRFSLAIAEGTHEGDVCLLPEDSNFSVVLTNRNPYGAACELRIAGQLMGKYLVPVNSQLVVERPTKANRKFLFTNPDAFFLVEALWRIPAANVKLVVPAPGPNTSNSVDNSNSRQQKPDANNNNVNNASPEPAVPRPPQEERPILGDISQQHLTDVRWDIEWSAPVAMACRLVPL